MIHFLYSQSVLHTVQSKQRHVSNFDRLCRCDPSKKWVRGHYHLAGGQDELILLHNWKWYLLTILNSCMLHRIRFPTVENTNWEALKGDFKSRNTPSGNSSGDTDLLGKQCLWPNDCMSTHSLAVPLDFFAHGLFLCFPWIENNHVTTDEVIIESDQLTISISL